MESTLQKPALVAAGVLWGLSYFLWRRLQVGDVVGVARRRVAGETGFDAQ